MPTLKKFGNYKVPFNRKHEEIIQYVFSAVCDCSIIKNSIEFNGYVFVTNYNLVAVLFQERDNYWKSDFIFDWNLVVTYEYMWYRLKVNHYIFTFRTVHFSNNLKK